MGKNTSRDLTEYFLVASIYPSVLTVLTEVMLLALDI